MNAPTEFTLRLSSPTFSGEPMGEEGATRGTRIVIKPPSWSFWRAKESSERILKAIEDASSEWMIPRNSGGKVSSPGFVPNMHGPPSQHSLLWPNLTSTAIVPRLISKHTIP